MKGLRILCLVSLLALVSGITVAQDRDVRTELEQNNGDIVMLDASTDIGIQYNKNGPQPFNIRIICDGDDCPYYESGTGGAAPVDTMSFSMCGKSVVAYNPILEGSGGDFHTDDLRIPRSGILGPENINCAPGTKSPDIVDSSSGSKVTDVPSEFNIDYKTKGGELYFQVTGTPDGMKAWRFRSGDGDITIDNYGCAFNCERSWPAANNTILSPFNSGTGYANNLNQFRKNPQGSCGVLDNHCQFSKLSLGSKGSSCNGDCPLGHTSDGDRPTNDLRGEVILSDSGKFHICDSELNGFKFMEGKIVTSSGNNFAEDNFKCQNDRWKPTTVPDPDPDPPPPPDPSKYGACTDGADTDGDGAADSSDPGCVKPYSRDGAESDYRDQDMTATFSGGAPSSVSASITKKGFTKKNAKWESSYTGEDESEMREFWFKKGFWSDSPSGTGYEVTNVGRGTSVTDGYSTVPSVLNKGVFLVDSYYSSEYSRGSNYCGNGQRNLLENNFNCPLDIGLPDDVGDTKSTSSQTITQQVGTIPNSGWSQGGSSDSLIYSPDLAGSEEQGTYNLDVTSSGSDKTYDATASNLPDPYMTSDPAIVIWEKTLKMNKNKFGSTTDWDKSSHIGTDYDSSDNSYYTDCDKHDGEAGENATCDPKGSFCVSEGSNEEKIYKSLKTKTDTHTANTQAYETLDSGSKPDVTESFTELGLTVNVDYNPKPGVSQTVEVQSCGTSDQKKKCGCTAGGGCGCDETQKKTEYKSHKQDYETRSSTTYNYYFQDLSFKDKKYFATDPSKSTIDVASNLWSGVPGSFTNNKHYWSVEKPTDNFYMFGNDPAVSSSEMKITHDGNNDDYWSTREWYGVFDADGPEGTGDSYVTIGHEQENEVFPASTKIESSSGDDPGAYPTANSADFVSAKGVSCGEFFCMSAQDVYMQNLDSWGDPSDPSTGYQIDDQTKPVSADYSVCRTFQEFIGGVEESYLRCQYDTSGAFPEGPTPTYELQTVK